MNANNIINEEMTLDQKLEAIDKALAEQIEKAKEKTIGNFKVVTDPAEMFSCLGCQ